MKDGWEYKKLGEVCEMYQPKTLATSQMQSDGAYYVYGANGIIGRYSEYNHEKSELLMTCRGATCGTLNVSFPKSWINGNAMVLHPKENSGISSIYFLKYLLNSLDLSSVITGAAQPQITRKSLSPILLPIPPLSEQLAIVEELDLLNAIIDKKKAELEELDKLAQSIFYDMFGDPVENEKGWEVKKIKNVAKVKIGPFGSLLHVEDYVEGGYPVINPIHMSCGKIVADMKFSIDEDKYKEMSSYILKENDIIFGRRGDIGRCALVTKNEEGFVCGTGSLFVRFDIVVDSTYVLKMLLTNSIKKLLVSKAKGATMLNINCGIVENLHIPLPPLPLQQQFASRISALEKMKEKVTESMTETQTLLAATMDKYFG